MRRQNFLRLGSDETIGGVLAQASLPPPSTAGTVRGWNTLALHAVREAQADLPAAARALAILHTCMYNAWAAYDEDARQTVHGRAVRLPRAERSAASKAGAMSHAAWFVLCEQFLAQRAGFDARMAGLGLDLARLDGQFSPAGIGRSQAGAMLDVRRREDADAPDEPAAALPFAPLPPDRAQPASPAATHAGELDRWCRLAHQLSEREGYDDDREVLLYFVLANALADAALAAADAGVVGAAAAVALRSFTGSAQADAESELGREIGARVFEKARRYWQGKL